MFYAIIIGLIILLVVLTAAAVMMNSEKERRRRLQTVVQGNTTKESNVFASKALEQDQRRNTLARKLKETSAAEKSKDGGLPVMIMQAGFDFSVQRFWIGSLLFAGVAFFVVNVVMDMSTFVTILIVITSFMGVPRLFLKIKAKRRQKKFLENFADSLEAMTRLLKAGMPVTEAIAMVGREYTGPIGDEMGRIYDQQKIGVSLPDAVTEGALRIPIPEMKMFATAVSIQAQTGSSLSEILQSLASVIRARFRLRRKVDALSSEAKSSAMIIGALPVIVATGMYFINREYIEVLFIDPQGKFLLGGAIFWMLCGCLVMRQMINFKV